MTHGSAETKKPHKKQYTIAEDLLHLAGCIVAIYGCYIVYGIIQEKLYKTKYGPNNERFTFSLFLTFFQSLFNGLLAWVLLLFEKNLAPDKTPRFMYFQIAFSYLGAMFASNAALSYVSYPTQALAKSCKMIPVMLARIFINGKRYTLIEYLNVILVTVGISVFMLVKDAAKGGYQETSLLGLAYLGASLVLDGYTGPTQENIVANYKPSTQQLMLWLNIAAVIMAGAALLVTGQLFEVTGFMLRFPEVVVEIVIFSILSALGQNFILMTLYRFDSLVLTTITTTRKFFTILASVVWFGHHLGLWQWIGVGLVFAGLFLDAQVKYMKKKSAQDKKGKDEA